MPAFAFCILPELRLHLRGARRILKDADLEEWILLEDRSPVLLDEVPRPEGASKRLEIDLSSMTAGASHVDEVH